MVRAAIAMLASGWLFWAVSGCGDAPATASAAPQPPSRAGLDPDRVSAIAMASYATSPPSHPKLSWPDLAPLIDAAHQELSELEPMATPAGPPDPLAERIGSERVQAIAEARRRATVLRAEAARLLARGQPDEAAREFAHMLEVARVVSTWGSPSTAEASADVIESVIEALGQPDGAPLSRALTSIGSAEIRSGFARLDANDPAGRMRAVVETIATRESALRSLMDERNGEALVLGVATRYSPAAELGSNEDIDRFAREAVAFSRALADGWDRSSRSAITTRLRQRQAEDPTGVLIILLGEAPDACDADADLRTRIAEVVEQLP
ncbi:MAG: hypothetical protein RIE77_11960 [Phycisphaerales bacterium]|jgi:hypothetical protein